MSDLISKSALLETLNALEGLKHARNLIRLYVQEAPTVEAAPVVHGAWKYYHKQNKAVCTHCSFERDLDLDFGKAVACPNCAAKMDL